MLSLLALAIVPAFGLRGASSAASLDRLSKGKGEGIDVSEPAYKPGEVVVIWKPGTSPADRAKVKSAARVASTLPAPGKAKKDRELLVLEPGVSAPAAAAALKKDPAVRAAGLNRLRRYNYTPSSADFPKQWGYDNTGQSAGGQEGTFDADIDAVAAWDVERGNSSPTTVAVIDSGIDLNHPNLSGRLWANGGEIVNGIDDDGNGYIDDVNGYNWAGISCYAMTTGYKFGADSSSQFVAQGFRAQGVNGQCRVEGLEMAFNGKAGNPTQTITYSIRSSLTGADIVSTNPIAASRIAVSGLSYVYEPFTSVANLTPGNDYFFVASTSSVDPAKYFNIVDHTSSKDSNPHNSYAEGSEWWDFNGAWTEFASDDFYFKSSGYYYNRDNNGHGTHCCGIVGAADAGTGSVGTAPGAATRLMALKAGDSEGSLWTEDWMDAIDYASSFNASVISMSFGGSGSDSSEQAVITDAYNNGAALFAAAGNTSNSTLQYPASYANVIGVGATDNRDAKASFSTYNSSVDVSAPGWQIYSTMPTYAVTLNGFGYTQNYSFMSGTSMATPMAAGLGALVKSRNPTFTPNQVEQRIEQNADDLGAAGRDDYFGYGRINARKAIVNGAVDAWGLNDKGQVGDGTTDNRSAPVQVSAQSGAIDISGGTKHSLALQADGRVRAWGDNQYGQLGNNSTTDSAVPVEVSGLAGVEAVDGGNYHSLALKSDGTVWAWGRNNYGQLGNNSTNDSMVPVQVSGLSGVVEVAAGYYHSLALKSDGTVWAWGCNTDGQLGCGTSDPGIAYPVQVKGPGGVGNLTGAAGIAAGANHSLARLGGAVYAWGDNTRGQLGDNTTTDRNTPVQVKGAGGSGSLTGVMGIAAGSMHSLAVMSDQTARAWGYNGSGQLGDNTSTDRWTPVQVYEMTGAMLMEGGNSSSYALKGDGTVWAWGDDDYGQLGASGAGDHAFPIKVRGLQGVGFMAGAVGLAGGGLHAMCIPGGPPAPVTTGIDPASKTAGSSGFTLYVYGSGFTTASVVRWNGADRTTTYVNGTTLTASISSGDVATAGTVNVTVFNPAPGGGTSNPQTFTINNPVPATVSISPTSKTAGEGAFTLTVNGSNFVSGSVVRWNGSDRATTYVNSTRVTAAIPASDITTGGYPSITVFNPGPGGGTSNPQAFTINNPVPATSGLDPASKTAGELAFTLTVNGSGFVSGSVVRWNSSPRTTSFVSSGQLTAAIPASDIAAAGTASVTVYNPTPGGGTSNAQAFTINNPVPATSGLDPSSKTAGDGAFTLTVNGGNFVSGSVVRWNSSPRTTSFVSSGQLTATVLASDIAAAGTASVTVYNPTPGGGTSNPQTFTINNPLPATSGISPSSKTAGDGAFTLTVNGGGFVSGSVVRWKGSDRATSFVSSTQLTASIPAGDIAAPGTASVTVYNPTPGGGTSNAQTFSINYPVPAVSALDPQSVVFGSPDFDMVVQGSGFFDTSVVQWNGADLDTKYLSATELQARVGASLVASPGTASVTVFNPTPGGGTSGKLTFTIGTPAPSIAELKPSEATTGGDGFTLSVLGKDFVEGCSIRWDGVDLPTTYKGAEEVAAEVDASLIARGGMVDITVRNPEPTAGDSNPLVFTVNNPVPAIGGLSPDHKAAGGGSFTLTVNGAGFVPGSVVRWNGSDRATTFVSAEKLTAGITAADIESAGTASVTVFNPQPQGGLSGARQFTIDPPVSGSSTWYLPEGTTAWGFSTYITIENPNESALDAVLTFFPVGRSNVTETVTLPARSQTTLTNDHLVQKMGGRYDFSTMAASADASKPIAVDRTMEWTGAGAASPEAHSSIGVNAPSGTWYLPEGSTDWGFETWLLIQNPNPVDASCEVTYMIEGVGPVSLNKTVPANSRRTFNMADDIGSKDASIEVASDRPVICERSMYRNNRREGHDSVGATGKASDCYLAEGTSAWGFTTYVLVQNANDSACDVTVTYMTEAGPRVQPKFTMPADSRKTLRVNDVLPGTDFSVRVHGSKPIVAERSMYWDAGSGEACHDSIGMSAPGMMFYLPDGQTSLGRETWTCVQNPNGLAVSVSVTYLLDGGGAPVNFTATVPANARRSYSMADKIKSGRAAIVVESKTANAPVMVERSMYWNSRGAGTDTIGGLAH